MGRIRTLFRRVRTLLWTALAIVTILAAILVGVGELLLPYSDRYQPRLEAWLTREFGRPVVIESFTGEWKVFGPSITLQGLTFLTGDSGTTEIALQHAQLDLKPVNYLLPGRPIYSFSVVGADLEIRHTDEGRWIVSGLGVSGRGGNGGGSGLRALLQLGEVRLADSNLHFVESQKGVDLRLSGVNGRLQLEGQRLAGDISARLNQEAGQVYGDLEARVVVQLDDEQKLADAQWHAKVRELLLATLHSRIPHHPMLPERGRLNAELWGSWHPGGDVEVEGVADLRDVRLPLEGGEFRSDRANALFRWRYGGYRSWQMDLADVSVQQDDGDFFTSRLSVDRRVADDLGLWLSADSVPANLGLQITQTLVNYYEKPWPESAPKRARGQVTDFDLILNGSYELVMARTVIANAWVGDWGRWPDIEGISGTVDLFNGEGQAQLSGTDVRITWPRVFRNQLRVEVPTCLLEMGWSGRKQWRFDAHACRVFNEDLAARGRAMFRLNDGKPVVDINVLGERGNIANLGDYWPENLLSDATRQWLRRGLAGGQVDRARFSMRGDMDDWPFEDGSGQFELVAPVNDGTIDYTSGWPVAADVDAVARFRNTAMEVEGRIGSLAGAVVDHAVARVADFSEPDLDLRWQTNAPLQDVLDFIQATPLGDGITEQLQPMAFGGAVRISGQLATPLRSEGVDVRVNGDMVLSGNTFEDSRAEGRFEDLRGTVEYDQSGFQASGLEVSWMGQPALLDIDGGIDRQNLFVARMSGMLEAQSVIPRVLRENEPLFGSLVGSCDFDVSITVRDDDAAQLPGAWLSIESQLRGVAIKLPAPLSKDAGAAMDLDLKIPLVSEGGIATARLGGIGTVQFDLGADADSESGDGSWNLDRIALQMGGGEPVLPRSGLYSLSGSVEELDLDGWMERIQERLELGAGTGDLEMHEANVTAGRLVFLNRLFEDVNLKLEFDGEILLASFDGETISGTVQYAPGGQSTHRLVAEFERLFVPESLREGVTLEMDPTTVPALHLYAREFSFLGMPLDDMRIESYPTPDGLHFETVEGQSEDLSFRARGDWVIEEGLAGTSQPRSDFDIHITSESLGAVLNALDISSALEGGQTVITFDAWWPGSPAAFGLAQINGTMEATITHGQLANADPGAGRMLGLMSIQALPRRLALDFSDVFGTGFQFDQAAGTLEFGGGKATTEGFVMQSSAANLTIEGTTNMVEEHFDYLVTVRPGLGSVLPVVGAVAGGPAGAAAGIALQALLQQQLGDAAQVQYTIDGPFEDPVVERIVSEPPDGFEPYAPGQDELDNKEEDDEEDDGPGNPL